MFSTIQVGAKHTADYKIYVTENGKIISPWHDIDPLHSNILTCVNEIPRFKNAKLEISKDHSSNPIMQDIKKNKLRYVTNIFPMKGYPWNYGAIPRTWENPNEPDPFSNYRGDNDPLDVIEIGERIMKTGEIYNAKVLGCLAMIDEGECDYKIIVIDVKSKIADKMEDISDVENLCPGLLDNTREWFRSYKIPDGKEENKFAFDGKFMNKEFAMKIVKHGMDQYEEMKSKDSEKSHHLISSVDQNVIEPFKGKNGKLPEDVNEYFFIKK